jgi:hypothetical protein
LRLLQFSAPAAVLACASRDGAFWSKRFSTTSTDGHLVGVRHDVGYLRDQDAEQVARIRANLQFAVDKT